LFIVQKLPDIQLTNDNSTNYSEISWKQESFEEFLFECRMKETITQWKTKKKKINVVTGRNVENADIDMSIHLKNLKQF